MCTTVEVDWGLYRLTLVAAIHVLSPNAWTKSIDSLSLCFVFIFYLRPQRHCRRCHLVDRFACATVDLVAHFLMWQHIFRCCGEHETFSHQKINIHKVSFWRCDTFRKYYFWHETLQKWREFLRKTAKPLLAFLLLSCRVSCFVAVSQRQIVVHVKIRSFSSCFLTLVSLLQFRPENDWHVVILLSAFLRFLRFLWISIYSPIRSQLSSNFLLIFLSVYFVRLVHYFFSFIIIHMFFLSISFIHAECRQMKEIHPFWVHIEFRNANFLFVEIEYRLFFCFVLLSFPLIAIVFRVEMKQKKTPIDRHEKLYIFR